MGEARLNNTLKERQATKKSEGRCSFCGTVADACPLLITSNTTGASICSWCALTAVEQTFRASMGLNEQLKEMHADPKAYLDKLEKNKAEGGS